MDHIVIIGSGFAGYEFARQFRQLNQETRLTIITQDDGNDYNKPTLSKALGFKMTPELLVSNTAEKLAEKLRATILTHTIVKHIDPQQQCIICEKTTINYSKLVLACGAKANMLNLPHTMQVNSLTDYRSFCKAIKGKKHISIIGGGLVGCEFACDLSSAGYEVSVISIAHNLMPKLLPPQVSDILKEKMAKNGVMFHLDADVDNITKNKVQLKNGEDIETDVILSAIGLTPNTALASSAGLDTNRGIITNEYLQTSNENIYALGDCAETEGMVFQHIAPIRHAAMTLAKNLNGEQNRLLYPPMMFGIKTPCYPIRVCRSPNISNQNWQVEIDEKQNAKALHYNENKTCDAFIFCGENVMDREGQQTLAKTAPNWLE